MLSQVTVLEARSARVASQVSGHDERHRESQRNHPQSLEKRQAVLEPFHDSPMDRSWRRHGEEEVPANQRPSPYERSLSRAQGQTEIS